MSLPRLRSVRLALKGLLVGMVTGLLVIGLWSSGVWAETAITVLTPEAENPQAIEWYQKVLKPAFEQATGIKLDMQVTSWEGYADKLAVLFASGKAPDVFTIGGELLSSYVQANMVRPLDQWAAGWEDRDDYPAAALRDVTVDGKLYAIPYRLDQRTLLYRKDFFEVVGLDPNHPPATWDELVQYGRKLVIRDSNGEFKRDALNLYPAGDFVGIFIFQNGGRLVTPDGMKAAFDSRPAVEAIQFVIDLSQRYQIGSPAGSPWKGANSVITGASAMEYAGAWVLSPSTLALLTDQRSLGVALPPKKVNRSGWLYVNKWGISSTSKHPDAAWRFVEFITKAENMAEISRLNGHLPARFSVVKGFAPWKDDVRWATFLAAAIDTVPLPSIAKLGDVLSSIQQIVVSVTEGKASLAQAVATQVDKVNQVLRESRS